MLGIEFARAGVTIASLDRLQAQSIWEMSYNSVATFDANNIPALEALKTTWSAIVSTPTVNAEDNTNTNPSVAGIGVPIYTLGYTLVASTNAELWSGTILNPINIFENGQVSTPATGQGVWTGTATNGTNNTTDPYFPGVSLALGSVNNTPPSHQLHPTASSFPATPTFQQQGRTLTGFWKLRSSPI
jgi:hypothetical protein